MRRRFLSQETLIYIVVWALLFVAPILIEAYQVYSGDVGGFGWDDIWRIWRLFLPFLAAFVLHNHLLAPLLVYRHKNYTYAAWVLVLMASFMLFQCSRRPGDIRRGSHGGPHHEARHELHHDGPGPFRHDGDFAEAGFSGDDVRPDDMRPDDPHMGRHKGPRRGDEHPPLMWGQHEILAAIILVLMLGMNLGVKLYMRQRADEQRMAERERRTLQQQLEYLKYQINPHFLMNTLNNIHALIDIAPDEAQRSIVDLSHLLRFVLYEGAKPLVPLSREVQFIRDYITLMRQRLSDCVTISMTVAGTGTNDDLASIHSKVYTPIPTREGQGGGSVPGEAELARDPMVPPLLFITFVENAFKHGVSYQHNSFVEISIRLDGETVVFDCRNSRRPEGDDPHGGVGLQNVRQRLELLFPGTYTLDIDDSAEAYTVHLEFPTA